MTANHEYTPDTEQVRLDYVQSCEGDRVSPEESGPQFDRWLATVEAAAEQRGAVKALRSAAQFFSDPGGERFASWAAIQQYLNDRADQMEGDE